MKKIVLATGVVLMLLLGFVFCDAAMADLVLFQFYDAHPVDCEDANTNLPRFYGTDEDMPNSSLDGLLPESYPVGEPMPVDFSFSFPTNSYDPSTYKATGSTGTFTLFFDNGDSWTFNNLSIAAVKQWSPGPPDEFPFAEWIGWSYDVSFDGTDVTGMHEVSFGQAGDYGLDIHSGVPRDGNTYFEYKGSIPEPATMVVLSIIGVAGAVKRFWHRH